MHKPALLAAALCCAALTSVAVIANADDSDRLIDCGKFKTVIMSDTKSKDGRYAVAWTIIPQKKGLKPVDWSLWEKDGRGAILDHYNLRDPNAVSSYEMDFMVIDLHTKQHLDLPVDYNDARRNIWTIWSGPENGMRHGVLEFEEHYGDQLYLVNIDAKGNMRLINLTESTDKPVTAALPAIPADHPRAVWVTEESLNPSGFHGAYVDIPFTAQLMNMDDNSDLAISGLMTLRLADGEVTHVTSYATDDLIQNDPILKKADAELNNFFRTLEKRLAPAAQDALKKDQRAWIQARDDAAAGKLPDDSVDVAPIRQKALLEATRKRTAELKARLAAMH